MALSSRASIREALEQLLVDNVTKSITPEGLKAPLLDMLDTLLSKPDDNISFAPEPTGDITSDTAALDAFFKGLGTSGRVGIGIHQYDINGTIAPASPFVFIAGSKFKITADTSGTYTEILESPLGETGQVGSGYYGVLDLSGCGGSVIHGDFSMAGDSLGGAVTLANRAGVRDDLVAVSACTSSAGEVVFENLTVSGFGRVFFQGDFRGSGTTILPYTRSKIAQLTAMFCGGMQTGQFGNGTDDMSVGVLRLSRCWGTFMLRGSDLTIASMFAFGLDQDLDREAQTIATTAGVADAMLSEDNSSIVEGTILVIRGAGLNGAGEAINHVTRVTAKTGTTLTLESAPEATLADAEILANPPSIVLSQFNLNTRHCYFEGIWDTPIRLSANSGFVADDFKISSGQFASRLGAAILSTGLASVVNLTLNWRARSSNLYKTVVGFGMAKDEGASIDAAILCQVKAPDLEASFTADHEAFACVQLPASLLGTYTDASGDTLAINAVVDFPDRSVTHIGTLGTNEPA